MARALSSEIEPYLEGGDRVENRTGLEFWFAPPDSEQKQAKRAWRNLCLRRVQRVFAVYRHLTGPRRQ
jgi:hypothetical protein